MIQKEHERIDNLHIKGYRIIQNTKGFCFGMDAVLLSGFAKMNLGDVALDIGTGTGIIPILMEAKYEGRHIDALEIQPEFVDMARRSIQMNGQEEKIHIHEGDINKAHEIFPLSSFDVITSNPPYMNEGKGLTNPSSMKAIARHEVLCTLEDIIRQATRLLKVGGHFYMVHRPHRLMDIMDTMRRYKCEPKRMRLVHSYKDKEATMVLIEGVRGGRPMMKVEAPLIIYDTMGQYSDEILTIYGMGTSWTDV